MPPRFDMRRDEVKTPRRCPLVEQNQRAQSPIPHVTAPMPGKGSAEIATQFKPHTANYMKSLLQQLVDLMATNPVQKNVKLNGNVNVKKFCGAIFLSNSTRI